MSTVRRFLVAPSLVRLIRKERGGARITEGHFAPQGGRSSYVRVDGQNCQLVLVNKGADGIPVEERKLVRLFGDAYVEYRRRVPALLPLPLGPASVGHAVAPLDPRPGPDQ